MLAAGEKVSGVAGALREVLLLILGVGLLVNAWACVVCNSWGVV